MNLVASGGQARALTGITPSSTWDREFNIWLLLTDQLTADHLEGLPVSDNTAPYIWASEQRDRRKVIRFLIRATGLAYERFSKLRVADELAALGAPKAGVPA